MKLCCKALFHRVEYNQNQLDDNKTYFFYYCRASLVARLVKNLPVCGRPGLGRFSGEGNGYPLQYSGLENSMDSIVYEVTTSQTELSDFHWKNMNLRDKLLQCKF